MIRRPLILKKAFFYPHFEKYEYVVYRKLVTMLLSADGFCCFFVLFRREVIHKKKIRFLPAVSCLDWASSAYCLARILPRAPLGHVG